MKRLAQLVFVLLLAAPNCFGETTFPIKVKSGGRYLVDANNQPFMIMADAAHHIMCGIPSSSWGAYLDDRKANGFNTVDIYALYSRTSSGNCSTNGQAYDGTLPFTSGSSPSTYDLSTPNSAYWSQVDTLVADAAARGLMVLIDPIPWGDSWSSAIINNGSTKDFNFGAYIGNRYKNSPNVMFYLGDDFDQSSFPSDTNIGLVAQIMAGIESTDPNHIVSCQLNYNLSYSQQANSHSTTYASALKFNFLYDYFQTYDGVYTAYNASTLPIWMGESNYELANNTGGLSLVANAFITRLQSWYTMTSGGAGFEFGNTHVNHFDSGYNSTSGPCSPTTCLDTTATLQQKYLASLFSALPWQTFSPDQTHTVVTAGYGTYNASTDLNLYDSNYATTTWDGANHAVIYAPVSTTLTVALSALSTSVNAYWYDPTAGTTSLISGSPFTNTGTHNFTTPAAHSDGHDDWVLVLSPAIQSCPSNVPSGVTNCYFVSANGIDTNSGRSELSPWKFSPGMQNYAGGHSLANGDGVIFRGGDTWHFGNSSAAPYSGVVSACWSNGTASAGLCFDGKQATSANPIYYGVDPAWSANSLWSRPILTGDNSPCSASTVGAMPDGATCSVGTDPTGGSQPTYVVSACTYQLGSSNDLVAITFAKYITFDNFELTGLCQSSATGQPGSENVYILTNGDQGPNTITNNYLHGMSHLQYQHNNSNPLCSSSICFNSYALNGNQLGSPGNNVQYNVFDFSDSDPAGQGLCAPGTDLYNFSYNVVRYNSQCIPTDVHTVHDNLFEYYYENGHSNLWEDSEVSPIGVIYNNVMRHMYGALVLWPGATGSTDSNYFFNNLVYDVTTSQYFDYGGVGVSTNSGSYFVFNNTLQSNGSSSTIIACAGSHNTLRNTNNHFVDDISAYPGSCSGMTNTTPISMTNTTATTDGYTSSQTYAYSPTLISSPTVSAGANQYSGYCSTLLASSDAMIQAAGTACRSDTTYACAYNSSAHTVSCPARTVVARPNSAAWDAGAYQFTSGGTTFTLTVANTNGSVGGTNCSSGTFPSGTSVGACTATPNTGYTFSGWSGTGSASSCSGTGTCSFTLTANSTLTANFSLNTYTLGVTATNGSVSGSNCAAGTYNYNTSIGVCSATPNAGYHFTGWAGTGSAAGCTGTGTCGPFSLTANSTITASFAINTYTLGVTATNGSLTGTLCAAGTYNYGTSIGACTAVPNTGYSFTGWTGTGSASGCTGTGTCGPFSMAANSTMTAAFTINTYTFSITATNGSVSGTNCSNGTYSYGTAVGPCTATPNASFVFTGWSGTGSCSSASGTGTASCTLAANSTLTANFSPSFSLTVGQTGLGNITGTNCVSGTYASGTSIGACTATPSTGYSFAGWSSTGSASCTGTGTCGPFSIAADSTLSASFTINSYTLSTATTGAGSGTITGCAGTVTYGASYSCTVTPSAGSTLTSVTGCGGSGTTTYTGTMPAGNCTVTADFSLGSYSLTVSTVGTGTVTGTNCLSGTYGSGTSIGTCTATAGTGYTFSGWSGTGSASGCTGTGTCGPFSIVSDSTLTATFTLASYTLSTVTSGTGTGTITGCAGSYNAGDSYSCTVAPGTQSTLTSVSGCGGSGTTTYAGTMPANDCTVTATFTLNTYTLGITATNGSVSGTNCSTGTYGYNTSIGPCTAAANTGYTFTGWSGTGACSGVSGTGTASCSLTSNSTLTAAFTINTYTLTVTHTNGSVSGTNCAAGTYNYNTVIGTCTATPNAGYIFGGWSGTGSCSSVSGTGAASCTLTSNSALTATFNLIPPPSGLTGNLLLVQ